MAKQFFTNGTGAQQTLTPSQDEKVVIYDTVAEAEADLANLEAGQIVATPDTGDELAQPVDEVTSGNMHAVTSNAVAGALSGKADISTGSFSINMPRSTIESQSGSYIKIGKLVFATVKLKITATQNNNDYFIFASPILDRNKEAIGSWHSFSANGYGSIQNSDSDSLWFIYNNSEYNVGQKVINDGGNLMLSFIYFTTD